jgi:transposase-like protein
VPKLRQLKFETAIIERYKRRESSVEEALIEMYLAGVSVRRVEDITEALWGTRVSPSTVSEMNKKVYANIEAWRNRPIEGEHPYVYLDGICLKRNWGGEVRNVSVLVAIGVAQDGFREVLGVTEGAKEDKASWRAFLRHLKERGLTGVRLVISDKCLGLVECIGEFFSEARWQRCMVHFYRNVFTVVPKTKVKKVATMLKAIHAQENLKEAQNKAKSVAISLKEMKLKKAAEIVTEGIEETLSYYAFPQEHWLRIRTNNPLERIMREIRRRTRVVGCFPDGNSALMLVAARLRHIAGSKWGTRKYLDIDLIINQEEEREQAIA